MPTETPAESPVEPRPGPAAPVARTVADDLETIFPDAPESRGPARRTLRLTGGRSDRAGGSRPAGSERRAARLGALAAVALVGVSAGALLSRLPPTGKAAPSAQVAARRLPIVTAPAPEPGPLVPDAVRLAAAPASPVAALPVAAVPVAARPAQARPVAVRPAVIRQPARRNSAPKLQRASTKAEVACVRQRRCGRASVMAADARLRAAYATAIRAGVSAAVLEDYRDRWWSLRRRAPREPARVVVGYRQMASELNTLAATRRRVHYAPRPDNSWRRLGTQFAELWQ